MTASFRTPLVLAALILAATAIPAAAEDFAQRKALHVHAEQQELVILTDSLACLANAIDEAALNGCLARKHQQLEAARAQYKTRP